MKPRTPQRYETLLRVRKHQEELKSVALAQERRILRDLNHQREDIEEYRLGVLQRAGTEAAERPVAGRLAAYHRFERHLRRLADDKDVEIGEQQQVCEEKRAELEEAIQRKRIVERLTEKAEKNLYEWNTRREQRFHDDLSAVHFAGALISRRKTQEAKKHESDRDHRAGHRRIPSRHHRPAGIA